MASWLSWISDLCEQGGARPRDVLVTGSLLNLWMLSSIALMFIWECKDQNTVIWMVVTNMLSFDTRPQCDHTSAEFQILLDIVLGQFWGNWLLGQGSNLLLKCTWKTEQYSCWWQQTPQPPFPAVLVFKSALQDSTGTGLGNHSPEEWYEQESKNP